MECIKDCDKIYDQYSDLLYNRYKDDQERLNMEVKNLPCFINKTRKGYDTLFYKIFNFPFSEIWPGKKEDSSSSEKPSEF